MTQYFTEFEIYDDNGNVITWGNSTIDSNQDGITTYKIAIKEMAEEQNTTEKNIRFKQFNKI